MKLYNLFYKAPDKIVEKRNLTQEEVDKFVNSLEKEYESDLKITEVKYIDDEER